MFSSPSLSLSVCRPEVSVGCLPLPPLYFLRQDLSLSLELTNSARLAGQQTLGIFYSPSPHHWDYRHVLLCLSSLDMGPEL